jgi:hypothetical protein
MSEPSMVYPQPISFKPHAFGSNAAINLRAFQERGREPHLEIQRVYEFYTKCE